MRKITKFHNSKFNRKIYFDYFTQVYFQYSKIFFGSFIWSGKRLAAFKNVLLINNILKHKELFEPSLIFIAAFMRISPNVFVAPLRLGSTTQDVPMPITEKKRVTLAVKWLFKLLKGRYRSITPNLVANILVDSLYNKGILIDKKLSVYKFSIKNRHLLRFFK